MAELVNVFATDVRKKTKKEIPTIEGGWVEFYDDLLTEEFQGLVNAPKGKELTDEEKGDRGYEFTKNMIADWNLCGKDEKKLEIAVETLKKLPVKVQVFLAKIAGGVFENTLPKKELPKS